MTDADSGQGQQGGYPPTPPGGAAPPPPPPPPGLFPDAPPQPQPQPQYAPPPPQQPQYAAPPPQPQYAPQYAAPPPPPTPVKKPRAGLIALVIGLVLVCGLGGCAAVVIGLGSGGGNADAVKQSEVHFTAAMSSVETASAQLKVAKDSPSAPKTTAAIGSATEALRTGRDEIAASKASAERIKDSQGKQDYLAALAAATTAMDGLQDLVGYMGTASSMFATVSEAGKAASKANNDLNAAISDGNSSSYTKMRVKATAASAGYLKASLLFRQADKLDKSAGLGKAAAYCDKRKAQADLVVKMADEGRRGQVSGYNADIKRMNAQGAAAEKIGSPAIVSDPNWAEKRLDALTTKITDAADKADVLHAKALKELGQ